MSPAMPPTKPPTTSSARAALPVVTQLQPAHLSAIRGHLLGLPADDRARRFGHPLADAAIDQYLSRLDFRGDTCFGVVANEGVPRLRAFCHLAVAPSGELAEAGVSVDADCRGSGYAAALLDRAILHAHAAGIETIVMYYRADNAALGALTRRYGMQLDIAHGDGTATLKLGPPTVMTVAATWLVLFSDWLGRSQAHADRLSRAARRLCSVAGRQR